MPLTLREALMQVEPLCLSHVVAGEKGLDNIVQFVNVMEVPDIVEWVHPGELLVTTMYPLRDNDTAIQNLVPDLARKGLAGLAVTPVYFKRFPQTMIDSADELGFPLIELPPNISFIDIIQPITSKILNLQANELIQSNKIHKQFIELVLGGGGFTDIAKGLSELVEKPVSIIDRFRRVLANVSYPGYELIQNRYIFRDETGDSYLSEDYQAEPLQKIPGSETKLMMITDPEGGLEHVVCPVKVGSSTLGRIIVWGKVDPFKQSVERLAIEHGSTVTALKMMEERSVREVEQRFRNEFLEGLLSDLPSSHELAVYQLREMGFNLRPPFTVIIAGPDLPPGTVLKERQEQSNIYSSLQLATRYLRAVSPEAVIWHQGPRLVIFLHLNGDNVIMAKSGLIQELTKICQRIQSENFPYTISMGTSAVAYELSQFRQAYDSAKKSLELGRSLRDPARSIVIQYEDLGIFRVTSLSESPAGMERFCQEMIGPLLTYDEEFGTDLVSTLRVFLEQNQNSAHAARVLHIHYNTLRYRLDRIRDLLGDALDSPEKRIILEVALQIHALKVII